MANLEPKVQAILDEITERMSPIIEQQIRYFGDNEHTVYEMMLACTGTMQWFLETQMADSHIAQKHMILLQTISGQILHKMVRERLNDSSDPFEDFFKPSDN
jgi:hypothetical protein